MAHHIKTAISLEQSLFDDLVRLAQSMQVSRSHLLAQALSEYLARRRNLELLGRINDAFADGPDDAEQATLRHARQQQRRLLRDDA